MNERHVPVSIRLDKSLSLLNCSVHFFLSRRKMFCFSILNDCLQYKTFSVVKSILQRGFFKMLKDNHNDFVCVLMILLKEN